MSNFVDQVNIKVKAGDGGNGMVAWRREKYEPLGGPAGGDGGDGGNVYLKADQQMSTLLDFHYKFNFEAEVGGKGGPKNKHGKNGNDLVIKVPTGTLVYDKKTNLVLADLVKHDQQVMLAQGGQGGRGNTRLATQKNRAPHFCEPGQPGVSRELKLELKLLADVGIIGMPNAGKSTLLSKLTKAQPKIADYPFSTLEPNLGVLKKPDGDGCVIADIPGLIEGASQGSGLGHKFLRHVERTRMLIHLVDASNVDFENNIATINEELTLYSKHLSQLPQILVFNKADVLDEDMTAKVSAFIKKPSSEKSSILSVKNPLLVSCATGENVKQITNIIFEKLSQCPLQPLIEIVEEDIDATQVPDDSFTIERHKNIFSVVSNRLSRIVAVTNLRDPDSLHHLHLVLRVMGVIDALTAEGAVPGSEVVIGNVSFVFGEGLY